MTKIVHVSSRDLNRYLRRDVLTLESDAIRNHLADCERCWASWNKVRWDAAATSPILEELKAFLGPQFQPYYDSSRGLVESWDRANPRTTSEVAAFFRSSTDYLYNLTIWQASGNRPPYVADALPQLHALGVHTILDYGCGIGNDTIPLTECGFAVTGCDFTSPSTAFLRWRTNNAIPVIEPSQIHDQPTPDTLWMIDTVDHLDNIDDTIGSLLSRVLVLVTENIDIKRGRNRKRFHHRRTRDQLYRIFDTYGLVPRTTGRNTSIELWIRKAPN